MFPIKNIQRYVTDKLDEITVFRKLSDTDSIIEVQETETNNTEEDSLKEVTIVNIPSENVWVFENEFSHQSFDKKLIDSQKGAFTSAGKKVEKTIIYYHSNIRLWTIINLELKIINLKKI